MSYRTLNFFILSQKLGTRHDPGAGHDPGARHDSGARYDPGAGVSHHMFLSIILTPLSTNEINANELNVSQSLTLSGPGGGAFTASPAKIRRASHLNISDFS